MTSDPATTRGAAAFPASVAVTKPTLGFPQNMRAYFPAFHNGGTMVNGVQMPPSSFVLEKTDKPY